MTINKKSGLIFGFLIGLAIAAVILGVSWLSKRGNQDVLKTQSLRQAPQESSQAPLIAAPVQEAPAAENPSGGLVDRLAPSEEEIVQDIQKNFEQLYGAN